MHKKHDCKAIFAFRDFALLRSVGKFPSPTLDLRVGGKDLLVFFAKSSEIGHVDFARNATTNYLGVHAMRKAFRRIRTLFRIAKGLGLVVWLTVSLAISTAGLALTVAKTTAQLAVATAKATQQAATIAKQSKVIKKLNNTVANSNRVRKKQLAKAKAKGRLRRMVVAVPAVGTAAAFAFEEFEFRSWRNVNPDGSRKEFGCQVWATTVEVTDEVLAELPEGKIRQAANWTIRKLPLCEAEEEDSYPMPLLPP